MNHNSITDDYLVGVARRGPRTSEVLDVVRDSVLDTTFLGRSLSRPCFLDYAQVSRLTATSTSGARPSPGFRTGSSPVTWPRSRALPARRRRRRRQSFAAAAKLRLGLDERTSSSTRLASG